MNTSEQVFEGTLAPAMSMEHEHSLNGHSEAGMEMPANGRPNGSAMNGVGGEQLNGSVGDERPHLILRNAFNTLGMVLSGFEVRGYVCPTVALMPEGRDRQSRVMG